MDVKQLENVKWYDVMKGILTIANAVVPMFVHNQDSRHAASIALDLAGTAIDGLANQNPDGTPAAQPYKPTQ